MAQMTCFASFGPILLVVASHKFLLSLLLRLLLTWRPVNLAGWPHMSMWLEGGTVLVMVMVAVLCCVTMVVLCDVGMVMVLVLVVEVIVVAIIMVNNKIR